MDNAARRNIHALAAYGETGMDCQAPSPDEDDRHGLSKIVGGSGSETLRRVPPKLSRITDKIKNELYKLAAREDRAAVFYLGLR